MPYFASDSIPESNDAGDRGNERDAPRHQHLCHPTHTLIQSTKGNGSGWRLHQHRSSPPLPNAAVDSRPENIRFKVADYNYSCCFALSSDLGSSCSVVVRPLARKEEAGRGGEGVGGGYVGEGQG